jgi:hypothetical protein
MVTGKTLKQEIRENVGKEAHIMTDRLLAIAAWTKNSIATAQCATSGEFTLANRD